MKKIFLLSSTLLFATNLIGQNVVTNGSFESKTGSECPWETGFDHGYPTNWNVPFHGFTPDYFFPCTPDSGFAPGSNVRGCEYPLDGQAYVGFKALEISSDNVVLTAGSEYMHQSITLNGGQTYKIEFWISRAEDNNGYNDYTASVRTIGMFLTTNTTDFQTAGFGLHHLTPQIPNSFPATDYYTSANGWTKISGSFTPTGTGSQTWNIVIGNFDSGINSAPSYTSNTQPSTGRRSAFYYVDAVSIIPNDQTFPNYVPSISGSDNICSGASPFTMVNQPYGTSVTWTASNSSGLSINSTSGMATPLNNYNGLVTITSALNGSCGTIAVTKSTWIGLPLDLQISGLQVVTASSDNYYSATQLNNNDPSFSQQGISGTGFEWTFPLSNTNQGWSCSNCSNENTWVIAGNTSTYVSVRTQNTCGYSNRRDLEVFVENNGCPPEGCEEPFSIYPNPSSELLTISSPANSNIVKIDNEPTQIDLIDSQGQTKYSSKTFDRIHSIFVGNMKSGFYYISIKNGKKSIQMHIAIHH